MKTEISVGERLMYQQNKKKLLFSTYNCRLFIVENFVVDEIEEPRIIKHFFGKPETIIETHYYINDLKIQSYHTTGKFCGYLTDDAVKMFVHRDLYYLRQNWLDLKNMLIAFGLEIRDMKEVNKITEPDYCI